MRQTQRRFLNRGLAIQLSEELFPGFRYDSPGPIQFTSILDQGFYVEDPESVRPSAVSWQPMHKDVIKCVNCVWKHIRRRLVLKQVYQPFITQHNSQIERGGGEAPFRES